ncbi:hypothetical protein EWF20_10960 [Sulfolobus sp. S-194]|uniref:hypothetical protein n=1 Tax=Sulfolobus sp. S-194 TaxID=2512240 RepID=UPI001436CE76|nr:hypothetical protein [Sulfolobus sp. S-194]QIW24602.1 hypothetical protein EWF20_10960 [Sulfolobus sp. S-194]
MKSYLLIPLILVLLSIIPSSMFIVHTVSQESTVIAVQPLSIATDGNYLYVTTLNGIITLTPNLSVADFIPLYGSTIPLIVNNTLYITNYFNDILSVIKDNKIVGNISLGGNFKLIGKAPSLPRMFYGYGMAFNPQENLLYVADSNLDYVVAINITSGSKTFIYGLEEPTDIIYYNGLTYVLCYYSDHIVVLDGTKEIETINVALPPSMGIIVNNLMYISSFDYSYVIALNLTSGKQTLIPTGNNPYFFAYDPENGNVYLTEFGAGKIAVIHGTRVIGNYSIGSQPAGIIYFNGLLYVALYGNNEIVALNPDNMSIVYSITLTTTYTDAIAYGPSVYVTEYYNNRIVKINSSGEFEISLNSNPYSITEGNGIIYVTCPNSNKVVELSPTLKILGYIKIDNPTWITYYNGYLYITSYNKNLLYIIPSYGGNITVSTGKGPNYVTVYRGEIIVADQLSDQLTIYQNGVTKNINLSFSPLGIIGYNDNIYIIGNDRIAIYNDNFTLLNVIYFTPINLPIPILPFEEALVYNNSVIIAYGNNLGIFKGVNEVFSYHFNSSIMGLTTLNGNIYVFSPESEVVILQKPPVYSLVIHESGLPNGMEWGVIINGSVIKTINSTLKLNLTEGVYNLTVIIPKYYYSNLTYEIVNLTSNLVISVHFFPILFRVLFEEKGLPNESEWGVIINGTKILSSNTSIVLTLPEGIYNVSIITPEFYETKQSIMIINITSNQTFELVFSPILFNVIFNESGLPNGMEWGVIINGSIYSTNSSTLIIKLPHGIYSYNVIVPKGYNSSIVKGEFTINNNLTITIAFQKIAMKTSTSITTKVTTTKTTVVTTSSSFSFVHSNNSSTNVKEYIGVLLIIVIGAILSIFIMRKR